MDSLEAVEQIKDNLERVRQLAIYVHACYELDSEATIGGNGVNSAEAVIAVNYVLDILGLKIFHAEVSNKVDEMEGEWRQ